MTAQFVECKLGANYKTSYDFLLHFLKLDHTSIVSPRLTSRERPIRDLPPMSDVRCCYGNIHRCRYRCRCGGPQSPLT